MQDLTHQLLAGWDSFFVILGSSAAALTGLQFVAMAMIAEKSSAQSPDGVASFATPTVVHFSVALFLSALLAAPWPSLGVPGVLLIVCGIWGVVYVIQVARAAKRQRSYIPVAEDWIWHVRLPFVAYALLAGSAMGLFWHPMTSLFLIGGVTFMLVIIGIHNAWDALAYFAVQRPDTHRH